MPLQQHMRTPVSGGRIARRGGWAVGRVLGLACATVAASGAARAQSVLEPSGATLTSYRPSATTLVQQLRPRFDQRGVGLDGGEVAPSPLGWRLAADGVSGGVSGGRRVGDLDLVTGNYGPTEVDLMLPSLGPPVVIGRTFNQRQESGSGLYVSNGYQGRNWAQAAQPEIVLFDADDDPETKGAEDAVYLVYGADRYVEFQRTGVDADTFSARNGAAGVVLFAANGSGPQTYTWYDQGGNRAEFFGFDTASGAGAGQLWRMTDAAGVAAYVGHATDAAAAIAAGYDAGGRVQVMYDGSGRRYTFGYTAYGSEVRLTSVEAEVGPTGWVTVGRVEYHYYTANGANGSVGDLERAVVIVPTGGVSLVQEKHYRYYTGGSSGGGPSWLKMVVGREGVRKYDYTDDGTFNGTHLTATDTALKPSSEVYLEYPSTSDARVSTGVFGGQCGCSGGTNGVYEFTYGAAAGQSAMLANTVYDQGWSSRAVIGQPDGTWVTQYFDEVGQPLARVITDADPAGTPGSVWVHGLARNGDGVVTQARSPANAQGYTHSTGAVAESASAGLVTHFTLEASGAGKGLRTGVSVSEGTGGTPTTISTQTIEVRVRTVGAWGVAAPFVNGRSVYPEGTAETATIARTWHSSTPGESGYLVPKRVDEEAPAVSTGKNGSGSAAVTSTYYRADGSPVYRVDPTGRVVYTGRNGYGQTARTIDDADTSQSGDFFSGDAPSLWGVATSGTGAVHVVRDVAYDDQGRVISQTGPAVAGGSRTSVTAYLVKGDGTYGVWSSPRAVGGTCYGPVQYRVYDQAGNVLESATIQVPGAGVSLPSAAPDWDPAGWRHLAVHVYDAAGAKRVESRTYTVLEAGPGGVGFTTDYDTTSYVYDGMGRTVLVTEPTGTIRGTVYDALGRVVAVRIGTDASGTSSDTMRVVEEREYDGGQPGGNSHVTAVTRDADGNPATTGDRRVTAMVYDYRGRLLLQNNPVAPHARMAYDQAGRVVAVGQYAAPGSSWSDPRTSATGRLGLSETFYDERGQVYRSRRHGVDPSTGALGGSVTDSTWYDAAGRAVKTAGGRITKTRYDRLGRAIGRFTIAQTDDASYADVVDVAGDIVLEESWEGLDPATGLPLVRHTVQRHHDDTTTGAINSNGAGSVGGISKDIPGRVQIVALWYDALDRVVETVAIGTNGGTTDYVRAGASPPSRSDTVLRTSTAYDAWGRVWDVTDPGDESATGGRVTRTEYDHAGRRVRTIVNYADGTPGGGALDDEDQVTEYVYTHGQVTEVTRRMPSSADDQTTTYLYGTTIGSTQSQIATGHLLREVIAPPQTTAQAVGERATTFRYNALGEVTHAKDMAGNVVETAYDLGGRVTARTVTTFASGFDTRVVSVETAYTPRGQVLSVAQKDSVGAVLDEADFLYDGWGNLTRFRQDPDSAIAATSGRDAFETTSTYELANPTGASTGGWSVLRPTGVEQPGGVVLTYGYNSALDAFTGRVSHVTNESVKLAEYVYAGAGSLVGFAYPEPNIASRLYAAGGSATYGFYRDRFNRVTQNTWVKELTGAVQPTFYQTTAEPTRWGGPRVAQDDVLRAGFDTSEARVFDRYSIYDGLRRLVERDEGEWDGTAIQGRTRREILTRNHAGLIAVHKVDLNGDGVFIDEPKAIELGEMEDTRTYNRRNELRQRAVKDAAVPAGQTIELEYTLNGQLKNDGQKYTYTYNPWGQLVEVRDRSNGNLLAEYTYNGLGMRLTEQTDTNDSGDGGQADGVVNAHDPVFYLASDPSGRRTAVYRGADAHPKETYIHHAPTAGSGPLGAAAGGGAAPILRDRNRSLTDPRLWATETAEPERYERLYYAANARGQVVALVDHNGELVEQYRWSATCVPFLVPLGDVNADGVVDADDAKLIKDLSGSPTYQVRGDLNLDGVIDSADEALVTANLGRAGGRASTASIRLRDGLYDGDVFPGARSVYSILLSRRCSLQSIDGKYAFTYQSNWNVPSWVHPPDRSYCDLDPFPVPDPNYIFRMECHFWVRRALVFWGFGRHRCFAVAQRAGEDCCRFGGNCMKCIRAMLDALDPCMRERCFGIAPIPPDTAWCDRAYPLCHSYLGANSRCFCKHGGDAPWPNQVRACLKCMYDDGAPGHYAHIQCYGYATRLHGRATLMAAIFAHCYRQQVILRIAGVCP